MYTCVVYTGGLAQGFIHIILSGGDGSHFTAKH